MKEPKLFEMARRAVLAASQQSNAFTTELAAAVRAVGGKHAGVLHLGLCSGLGISMRAELHGVPLPPGPRLPTTASEEEKKAFAEGEEHGKRILPLIGHERMADIVISVLKTH